MSNELVTLVCPQTEFEANVLAIVLRDHGIDAYVFAASALGTVVPLSNGSIGVPLQVRQEDLELAQKVLLENKQHSIDIDWDDLELGGSEEETYVVKQMPVSARIAFFFAMLALLAGVLFVSFQFLN